MARTLPLLLCGVVSLAACHLFRLEQELGPADADFLSRVRLIITRRERKVFLELPDAGRPSFVEEFWRRRDPDPATEANEFKDEYEKRVEEAARLFRGEAKPGWLTDRGRILILFGPPHDRLASPARGATGAACTEEWFYGNFPVVFVDRHCTGEYRLETTDLSSLSRDNLMYLHEFYKAQAAGLSVTRPDGLPFDYQARLHFATKTGGRWAGFVYLRLPLDRSMFGGDGGLLRGVLDVRLVFHSGEGLVVWESVSSPELEIEAADLDSARRTLYHSFELPFSVEGPDKTGRLARRHGFLLVTLTVRADGRSLQKKLELR